MPSEGSCGKVCRLVLMVEHSIHLFLWLERWVVGHTRKFLPAFQFSIRRKGMPYVHEYEIINKWFVVSVSLSSYGCTREVVKQEIANSQVRLLLFECLATFQVHL